MVSLFQMNSYVTHEQTLKAAQDHIELGKNEYSYNLLHEYIVGGKKKGNWSLTFEKLMTLFIDLSLKLENYSSMKEALTQYRQLSQFSNINSLESVLIYYREKMEQIFEEKIASKNIIQLVEVEEFDLEESNEDIMLYSLDTRQKSQREELKSVLRNLLDTYKNIIDIVRRNKKLEDLLVSTSEKAYDFCLKYKRRNEFKRLSESFFNYLTKIILPPLDNTKKNYQIDITAAETNDRFLAISFKQLNVAFAFELWQEAFRTIESINHIFYRRHKSPKTKLLSNYFDQLASVFWRSEYYLYHAYAFYQHFIIFKKFSKASPEEISNKTDYFVLSVLSIPPFGLENDQSEENRRRLCKIVSSAGSVSTRAELISTIQSSNLLDLVSPTVRDLFILMEEKFSLLNFGGPAESLLKRMEESPAYKKFINQIKTNFAYKAIENASNVYKTMKTSTLKRFLFFLNSDEIERILLNTHIHEHIRVRINQEKQVLIFNQMNTKADFSEASLHIVNFAYGVKEVVGNILDSAQENTKQEEALKAEARLYLQNAERTLKERMVNIQNNQRKDPNAERQFLEQQEEQKREERKRNEEDERKRRKEMERREKEAELIELSIKKKEKILQDILKIKGNQIVKIDGKRLEQFKRDELIAVDESTLTELKSMIQNREKENVENKYKRAFQRADYIERARREEEIKLLKETFHSENQEIPNILTAHRELFDKNGALKETLLPALRFKEDFVKEELQKRESKYKEELEKYNEDVEKKYKEAILNLARQKKKEYEKKTKEEAERRKILEEEESRNLVARQTEERKKFGEVHIGRGDKVRATQTDNKNTTEEKSRPETELQRSDRQRVVAPTAEQEKPAEQVWRVAKGREVPGNREPEEVTRKPAGKPDERNPGFGFRSQKGKPENESDNNKKPSLSQSENTGTAPYTHPGRSIPDSGDKKPVIRKEFSDNPRNNASNKDITGPVRGEKKDLSKTNNEQRREPPKGNDKPAPSGGNRRTFL